MKCTALLPMKGHSERVPDKNIRDFCGKPLYHHITQTLHASQYIWEVVINTDSEKITRDAQTNFNRVRIIKRPEKIRGDFVEMNTIIRHDLSQCEGKHFLQTHSTNPLLRTETIDRAVEAYFENLGKYDSLFSVTRWQTRFYYKDGKAVNHNPRELLRTQDLPPLFEENSNIYIFSKESFAKAGEKRIGLKPFLFEIDRLEAVDIDEETDFILAETLFRIKD